MKVGKQIRIVSYYTPEAVEKLDRLSDATRITKAVLLREALDDLLKKHGSALRKAAK
jgi:predicted DNA-binding protein